jgi:hypothetical protein
MLCQIFMSFCINMAGTSLKWSLLRKGSRVFGLLGKATPFGITSFNRQDLPNSWALTAEFGCLRLERLAGDEEVTGDQLVLPTPFSYDYGLNGPNKFPEVARAIFGLLPPELDQLVTTLRRGGFPMMGFSHRELKCAITGCTIPGYWPHVVISNMPLYGNVVSLETFVRTVVASLPQGQLTSRYPSLQTIVKQMMRLMILPRRGLPYSQDMLELTPAAVLATK